MTLQRRERPGFCYNGLRAASLARCLECLVSSCFVAVDHLATLDL